ncbi:MAG: MOSC domain-containing protein [Phycisphaerales bacterium]|nr:MOSC domain-containing protein [Phycisphaerales bacterium]
MILAQPTLLSINRSNGGIPKLPVTRATVSHAGIAGDAHDHEKHNRPEQAICLHDVERMKELFREGFPLVPGAIGENFTVSKLNAQALPIGTRLLFEGGLELEITKVRKPCFVLDAIDPQLKVSIQNRCGVYARVITPGEVTVGAAIHCLPPAGHTDAPNIEIVDRRTSRFEAHPEPAE